MTNEMINILLHVLLQGLIYSCVVLGVYLSSRVIKFDDLTTEGSFSCGGAITGVLIVLGVSPWLALALSILGGSIAGLVTGVLHTKLKMNNLISGLVVTTALFSVCLKCAGSNLSLMGSPSIFASQDDMVLAIALLTGLVTAAYMGLKILLQSEIGLLLKALGCNPQMVTSLGKDQEGYKIFALAVANALTALAGSLFVQWNGFYSITGSIGTLIIGLAGLILGEVIKPAFGWGLIAGAILYQAIFAITIEFELDPVWNNLIKAVLIVVLIQLKPYKEVLAQR